MLLMPLAVFCPTASLLIEDPETIGAGRLLIEAGFDYGRGVAYLASGLEGNLLRVPLVGVSIGQLDCRDPDRWRLVQPARHHRARAGTACEHADGHGRFDVGCRGPRDRHEDSCRGGTASRPAFGVRFAIKLPNASNESGLGLDTTDFFASAGRRQDGAVPGASLATSALASLAIPRAAIARTTC